MSKRSIPRRRARIRWACVFAIVVVLVMIAALAYQPAVPATSAASSARSDPAMQSVLAYLRAHGGAQPTWAAPAHQNAAQQGIMGYVRAHEPVPTPTATGLDAITSAVLDYLRAHSR